MTLVQLRNDRRSMSFRLPSK